MPLALLIKDRQRKTIDSHYWQRKRLLLVAAAGALPDLLSPHITLEERFTSYSHSIIAGIIICILFITLLGFWKKDWRLALFMSFAYLLHLATDAVSGGIAWLYPLSPEIIGGSFIPYSLWPLSDLSFALLTYWFFIALPKIKKAA